MTPAARLRITLLGLDPTPWRVIEVPLSMSFKELHYAIQAAFGWFDVHIWEFDFDGRIFGPPTDSNFGDERIHNAANAQLTKLHQAKATSFLYTYDLTDDWVHCIDIVELFDAGADAPLPRFLEGEWRAPPEDVRGPPGFEHFLEALLRKAAPCTQCRFWCAPAGSPTLRR
ncbi:MAG: plasmid pRiA4b ORF-3 family protein [Haliea sp.]